VTGTLPTQGAVDEVARELAPDVVRIRVDVHEDWSGDPAIYFRVILSDEASREDRLTETTGRVSERLSDELRLDRLDHIPYFSFRSQTEQELMRDPKWE
jgi:hypothetical protein